MNETANKAIGTWNKIVEEYYNKYPEMDDVVNFIQHLPNMVVELYLKAYEEGKES